MSSHRIPRDKQNDYSREAATARRDFVMEKTGVELEHIGQYSTDSAVRADEFVNAHETYGRNKA